MKASGLLGMVLTGSVSEPRCKDPELGSRTALLLVLLRDHSGRLASALSFRLYRLYVCGPPTNRSKGQSILVQYR